MCLPWGPNVLNDTEGLWTGGAGGGGQPLVGGRAFFGEGPRPDRPEGVRAQLCLASPAASTGGHTWGTHSVSAGRVNESVSY